MDIKSHRFLSFSLSLLVFLKNRGEVLSSICCVPDQLEALLIYDLGQCFIDTDTAYSFTNSTVRMAYDYKNKRTFFGIAALEISPLIPNPVTERTTVIYDYAKGIQYTFDGKTCTKDKLIDPMEQRCIPDNAVLESELNIGPPTGLQVKRYSFILSGDLRAKVRVSIDTKSMKEGMRLAEE